MNRPKIMGWLVGAAARRTMAAAALAAALVLGMTACSSENDLTEEPVAQQPAETATKIHVTVGAGINNDGATTRSFVVESEYEDEEDGTMKTRRTLTFTEGDRLYIIGSITPNVRTLGGLLTIKDISADGKTATFEGDLTVWVNDGGSWNEDKSYSQEGDPMTWYGTNTIKGTLIPAAMAADAEFYEYDDHGNLDFLKNYSLVTGDGDLANKAMESVIEVWGFYDESDKRFNLGNRDAIFNCTFRGLEVNTEYYVCYGKADSENDYKYIGLYDKCEYVQTVTTDGDGTVRFAFASTITYDGYYAIQLSTNNNFEPSNPDIHSCVIGHRGSFAAKVYNVNRYWDGTTFVKPVDLAKLSADYEAKNGDVLTGTLGGNYKITIAGGATVTLCGATIPGRNATDNNTPWAGITCLGDATIVLADGTTNYVKGYNPEYLGIQAAKNNTGSGDEYTLTIRGTGKLTAETGMGTNQGYAAGIGGGYEKTVGNIRIESGTITARGNMGGAGIGSGVADYGTASCGDITITGGTVTAVGGMYAAGIGSGVNAFGTNSCGDITISGSATGTATGGDGSPYDIGAGYGGSCGTVSVAANTISGVIPGTAECMFTVRFFDGNSEASVMASKIIVRYDNRDYEFTSGAHGAVTNLGNFGIAMGELPRGRNMTLTFTAETVAEANPHPSTGTFTATATFTITGASCDLGEVNLVKQQ